MSDLQDLFAKDPLQYTRDDLAEIIEAYREKRKGFKAGNLSAGSAKKPSPKQAEALSLADKLGLDLGDL